MDRQMQRALERWRHADLIDVATVERIQAYEAGLQEDSPTRFRWPAILAISFGALMVGAGILLFVAAHWDSMGTSLRFVTVMSMVATFHLTGVWFTERMPKLATAMHALGTLVLGAGIFLAGQIFNLQEHWPGGIMLWALGAWIGYALLRDWVQGSLAAILTPFWLCAEWAEATKQGWSMADGAERILAVGILLLSFTYLSGRRSTEDSLLRKSLAWMGGLSLLPAVIGVIATTHQYGWRKHIELTDGLMLLGWGVALLAPMALAFYLRGKASWMNLLALLWSLLLGFMSTKELFIYAWCALGSVGLVAWGLHEERRERVNLGVVGFAITLVAFYFSSVMDKLGRSLGLMGLGLLFLLGGWQLERLRRNLNARIASGGVR